MNNKGKNKLFIMVGLTILLFAQIILFISKKQNINAPIYVLFLIIALLSVVAVLFSYMQVREIDKKVKTLKGEYYQSYMGAIEIVQAATISKSDKRKIEEMILEIFEHAQLEERNINDIVKTDINNFVQPFIEAVGGQYSKTYVFAFCAQLYIGYLLLIKLYKVSKYGIFQADVWYSELLDVGIVGTYALIAFVFFPWMLYVQKKASIEQWAGLMKIRLLMPFVLPIGLVVFLIGTSSQQLRNILDIAIPLLNTPMKVIVSVLLIFGFNTIMRSAKKDKIRNALS